MKRQYKNSVSQKGFGMVEVLISMAVVSFGLLGVAKLQSNMMTSSAESKTRTEALYAANQKIEELRSFTDLSIYNGIVSNSDTVTANSGSNANLARTWTITDVVSPNYKTITVNVTWTDSKNSTKSVSMTSYISMSDPIVSGKLILG